MKYLKIKAKTYHEAMTKLKMDYGDEAIPISHKYVKEGGLFNSKLFSQKVVELTAAVQERKMGSRAASENNKVDFTVGDSIKKGREQAPGAKKGIRHKTEPLTANEVNSESINKTIDTIDTLNNNLNRLKAENRNIKTSTVNEKQASLNLGMKYDKKENRADETIPIKDFTKEFHEIKNTLDKLLRDQGREHNGGGLSLHEDDLIMKPYVDLLESNDFNGKECQTIITQVKNSISKDDLKDKFKIEKSLKDLLKSRIVTTGPIQPGNKKKIIMFIGPTGVGKTTTMAKLGALYSLREGHNVVFVTIDNYRIAATEQLKKYAEIIMIPVYSVNNQKDFKDIIDNKKAEIIMMDTSGRSHNNELKISEIKSYADLVEYDLEKILCVSANTKKSDLDDIFKAFDIINFNSIIITKVDETSFVGNVIDVADKYKKPIAYFTNGQEVPNDIIVADPDNIVNMIVGDIKN